jgi:hypothetical protein
MADAPPLPDGLHLWITEEMGFRYDPRASLYIHPEHGVWARVSAGKLQEALARGLPVQTVQAWIAEACFTDRDVEQLGLWDGDEDAG